MIGQLSPGLSEGIHKEVLHAFGMETQRVPHDFIHIRFGHAFDLGVLRSPPQRNPALDGQDDPPQAQGRGIRVQHTYRASRRKKLSTDVNSGTVFPACAFFTSCCNNKVRAAFWSSPWYAGNSC